MHLASSIAVDDEDSDVNDDLMAITPNGAVVICPSDRWTLIVEKHPVLRGQSRVVADAIEQPDEIRQSRRSPNVWLCYRRRGSRFMCAVIAPRTGLLLTAYPTDAIKAGGLVWRRSE